MEAYRSKRANIKSQLTRFANQLELQEVLTDIPTLRVRLERAEPLYDKYDEVQSAIELLVDVEDDEHEKMVQTRDRDTFEKTYFTAIAKARGIVKRSDGTNSRASQNIRVDNVNDENNEATHQHNMNLPKLNVPTFDGDYEHWVKFRDSFISMVDSNTKLSNIQKFHYLDQAVIKDAKRAIAAFSLSGDNYVAAWETLKSRYEDENELINHHVSGIFGAPSVKNNTHFELRLLLDTIYNHVQCLKTLNEPTDSWDTLIMYLLKSKLNDTIKNEWERAVSLKTERATFNDMKAFLERHCKFLYKTVNKSESSSSKTNKPFVKAPGNHSNNNNQLRTYTTTTKVCILCKGEHALYACNDFKRLSPSLRVQKVREFKLCFNCLGSNHQNIKCTFGPCRRCGRKHNSLLHLERATEPPPPTQGAESRDAGADTQRNFSARATPNQVSYVLLATARIYVHDKSGNKHECRALLDQGSQPHIMTNKFCKKLGLQRTRIGTTLSGIEQGNQCVPYQVTTKVSSRVTDFSTIITCLVIDKISDNLPSQRVQAANIMIPKGIELADPSFDKEQPIDMLIGSALFYELLCVGQIKLKENEPYFQKTLFGWLVGGSMQVPAQMRSDKLICNKITNSDLNSQLEKFWEIENCFSKPKIQLLINNPAEQHFKQTTERNEKGRFIVSIPFKQTELSLLGSSRDIALKRLFSIEKKLAKNPLLREQYMNFMKEYETLGHMSEIPASKCSDNKPHYYLPHHAVLKEDSTTTKLRVVFDGSAKTSTGISLNDTQHIGAPVQDDLVSILLRFRHHNYVLSADVAKMYRQIEIKKDERAMQRILWRTDDNSPIKVYELNTVTYGTASAPFLATRCLHEIGQECKVQYPRTSNVILHDFYVDDLLSGAQTIDEATQLKHELNTTLEAYGLELRKWASNDVRIIQDDGKMNNHDICIHGDKDPKTLGLVWDSRNDILKYTVKGTDLRKITKRTILSITAQIFDPLGLVSPAIIKAKVLMQKLWTLKLDWDESLPQDIHTEWTQIYQEIMNINEIVIPRHALSTSYKGLEFHGFCDASEIAYGACIYICSINKDGTRNVQLLCAKSRVAPLKATSIPRLELLGALLLAQLSHKVLTACNANKNQWHFWTDSMVVLAWIKSTSKKWKTFVANRTAEIQELTNERWKHVESAHNPADLISRGVSTTNLRESNLWWNGPSWLSFNKNYWPVSSTDDIQDTSEQRKIVHSFILKQISEERADEVPVNQLSSEYFERFSSFTRIVRTTAYIFRFYNNCKGKTSTKTTADSNSKTDEIIDKGVPLCTSELDFSRLRLIKIAQFQTFYKEISELKNSRRNVFQLKNSKLNQLHPFLDDSGYLRVGGRLSNAKMSFDEKHPMILAANHKLTHLLIRYEHKRLLHAGCQAVINSLRKRYWPLTGKNIVKKILRECVICFKVRPSESTYIMGDLPSIRVTPMRAFYNCGVDFAGPFYIKEKARSRVPIKAYMCIFVCLVTKAVHIELSVDLSTEAFVKCLKRFFSRRGMCKNLYCDNGTNFVGAKNELVEVNRMLKDSNFQNNVTDFLSNISIDWHFIPPHAPNFGGVWESAVKSAKYHLKRVVGETRLTYEEFYTVLTQIEACLNSRPLSPLSNDPNDLTPLTPGHFLIGDALTAHPQADLRNINMHRLNRYQHLEQMTQHFWQRWHQEYLSQLQYRPKKKGSKMSTINPGTLVLIKEDNSPPLSWPLGRITELHPGKDGVTRVVSIQVARGIIKRPVTRICILPINAKDGLNNDEEGSSAQQLL